MSTCERERERNCISLNDGSGGSSSRAHRSIVPSFLNNKPGFFSLGTQGRSRDREGEDGQRRPPPPFLVLDYISLVWTKAEILSSSSPPRGRLVCFPLPSLLRWNVGDLRRVWDWLAESWGRRGSGQNRRFSGASCCCLSPSGMYVHSPRRERNLCTFGKQVWCSRLCHFWRGSEEDVMRLWGPASWPGALHM